MNSTATVNSNPAAGASPAPDDARLDTALEALNTALAARPKLDGHAFTAATEAVCAYRDDLRKLVRQSPEDAATKARLRASNLIITLLLAGHYPLGDMPWAQLEGVRGQIEALRSSAAA